MKRKRINGEGKEAENIKWNNGKKKGRKRKRSEGEAWEIKRKRIKEGKEK